MVQGIILRFFLEMGVGSWLLAIGYWLLAIGYWLLAVGSCLSRKTAVFWQDDESI